MHVVPINVLEHRLSIQRVEQWLLNQRVEHQLLNQRVEHKLSNQRGLNDYIQQGMSPQLYMSMHGLNNLFTTTYNI